MFEGTISKEGNEFLIPILLGTIFLSNFEDLVRLSAQPPTT